MHDVVDELKRGQGIAIHLHGEGPGVIHGERATIVIDGQDAGGIIGERDAEGRRLDARTHHVEGSRDGDDVHLRLAPGHDIIEDGERGDGRIIAAERDALGPRGHGPGAVGLRDGATAGGHADRDGERVLDPRPTVHVDGRVLVEEGDVHLAHVPGTAVERIGGEANGAGDEGERIQWPIHELHQLVLGETRWPCSLVAGKSAPARPCVKN